MEWYIKKGHPLNLDHFLLRAIDSGDWKKETISEKEFKALLAEKIENVNMNFVKADISRFIRDPKVLDIWTPSYFHDLTGQLKFEVR